MEADRVASLSNLAKLESISQGAGEKVRPFLCRIRAAAGFVQVMKFGKCSKETHPNLTLDECNRGRNDEPAIELSWPCAKGAGWDTLTRLDFGSEGRHLDG